MKRKRDNKPKWSGSLGLGSLENKNRALLAQWWWRCGDKEALWRTIIAIKYGEDNWGRWPNLSPNYHRSGMWGDIASIGCNVLVR